MNKKEQGNIREQTAKEIVQQERVICTVAADLLMMNKMLEEDKKKTSPKEKPSFFQSVMQRIRTKLNK